ncbi:glycoside hydrolase domain-containing protein [Microbacterium sp. CFBP 8794]|uniref:glycoside hydrolase domain-containing protein n=1 Tax=Microbacterium sp. CFBP 8794 TaxID=2775269 RepID=UPI001780A492|nr:glycoside hydrolase domain-containing protein [Microbacterium sp. CFBP 8794]MBD8478952.1 DUF1906 domain-containing protein [Microbacterium sp. CFBP 8794]
MSDPWVSNTQKWLNINFSPKAGFSRLDEDGVSGWQTMYALTRSLQFELGVSPLSDNFGAGTLAALTSFGSLSASNPGKISNIVKIAQGALYCKGYNAGNGGFTGLWDATTQQAVTSLRSDLGLGVSSSDLHPKIFKFLLTMDAATLVANGDSVIRAGQRAMNARYINRRNFYVVPTDGVFQRDIHRALMYAVQYELGLDDDTANGNFGPTTKSKIQSLANIGEGSVDSSKYFVRWFNFALRVNGFASTFSGSFTATTASFVKSFEQFAALPVTGRGNVQTWGSLLVSTGDDSRPGAAADCITTLTSQRLSTLKAAGYTHFGRYLANTIDNVPDKELKRGEAARIVSSGGRIFPLFQTGGSEPEHFTAQRGKEVAEEAAVTAWANRIPANAVIYFSVDYDISDPEITRNVIPYFRAVNDNLSKHGRSYRVGIYGPRSVCKQVSAAGLAVFSFVSDMSTGYAGNIGQTLPTNWAFDQIQTLTVAAGSPGMIEIDKNIVSGRDAGVSALATATNVGDDPLIPSARFAAFGTAWFDHCYGYGDSALQKSFMTNNREAVTGWVRTYDSFITGLARKYKVYKALVLTPLIWEGLAIWGSDAAKDEYVRSFYRNLEKQAANGNEVPSPEQVDSSTGPAQIFARTAILARTWARDAKLITEREYKFSAWRDRWEVWQKLSTDFEYSIETCLLVMMYYANTRTSVGATDMRYLTPAQVMSALTGYNGDGIYGRKRMTLYYLIQRWHQDFRS